MMAVVSGVRRGIAGAKREAKYTTKLHHRALLVEASNFPTVKTLFFCSLHVRSGLC